MRGQRGFGGSWLRGPHVQRGFGGSWLWGPHVQWRRRVGVAATALVLSGCASTGVRVENGVFRAPTLFRVTVPGPEWDVATASRAELELRHRGTRAGILANAECGEELAGRDLAVLARRLFVGLRGREVLENGAATVGGVPAVRAVMDAQVTGEEERMRVEAYVVKDGRCVYDLVYVAPGATFEAQRPDFRRFVESFVRE
jgi:hypothetical protein